MALPCLHWHFNIEVANNKRHEDYIRNSLPLTFFFPFFLFLFFFFYLLPATRGNSIFPSTMQSPVFLENLAVRFSFPDLFTDEGKMEKGLEVFEIYKLFDVEIFHVRVRCVGVPSTRSYILYESCKFANVKNLFVKRIYTYALLPSIVSNNKCISLFEHFTIWNVPGNAKSFS